MPWDWQGRGATSADLGGNRGTPEEARVTHAWPKYEAEYLRERLMKGGGKYDGGDLGKASDDVRQHIYYDKITEDYKREADECLKAEFNQWLQGSHPANLEAQIYENGPGKPVRRHVYRGGDTQIPGEKKDQWNPTWWGHKQLTHLQGVREYLRSQEMSRVDADLKMNLLAEHGPQDLESAWMYFKHWVKGRPVAPELCLTTGKTGEPGQRSEIRNMEPGGMRSADTTVEVKEEEMPDIDAAAAKAAASAARETGSTDPKAFGELQNQLNQLMSSQSALKQELINVKNAKNELEGKMQAEVVRMHRLAETNEATKDEQLEQMRANIKQMVQEKQEMDQRIESMNMQHQQDEIRHKTELRGAREIANDTQERETALKSFADALQDNIDQLTAQSALQNEQLSTVQREAAANAENFQNQYGLAASQIEQLQAQLDAYAGVMQQQQIQDRAAFEAAYNAQQVAWQQYLEQQKSETQALLEIQSAYAKEAIASLQATLKTVESIGPMELDEKMHYVHRELVAIRQGDRQIVVARETALKEDAEIVPVETIDDLLRKALEAAVNNQNAAIRAEAKAIKDAEREQEHVIRMTKQDIAALMSKERKSAADAVTVLAKVHNGTVEDKIQALDNVASNAIVSAEQSERVDSLVVAAVRVKASNNKRRRVRRVNDGDVTIEGEVSYEEALRRRNANAPVVDISD